MILAAGRGVRLRPLTDTCPKPLLPVRGRALIDYHLEKLAGLGVEDVVVNLSWLAPMLRAGLGDGSRWGLRLHYSEEGPEALETGGGIFQALPWLAPDPFLVVNGDVYTDFDFATLTLPDAALAQLLLVPNPPHHPGGDFALSAGRVQMQGEPRWTYAGIGLYRPALFEGCQPGRFPLLPLLVRASLAGRLQGQTYAGAWSDVGTPERLAALQ